MRYAAPERLAGKAVDCPKCGTGIEVPYPLAEPQQAVPGLILLDDDPPTGTPPSVAAAARPKPRPRQPAPGPASPQAEDPLAGLFNEEFVGAATAGPAAGVPGAGIPAQSPLAGGTTLAPKKRKKKAWDTSQGGHPFSLRGLKVLAVVVGVFTLGATIAAFVVGPPFLGWTFLVLGVGVTLFGFASDPRRPLYTKADLSDEGRGCGTVFAIYVAVGIVIRFIRLAARSESGELPVALMILMGLLVLGCLIAGVVLVVRALGRMFGAFRVSAWLYMGAALLCLLFAPLLPGPRGTRGDAERADPVPIADLPERPPMRALRPGVQFAEVRLPVPPRQPGHESRLYLYLPTGSHAPKSLPCVLIASAGTNLLSGMELGAGDQPEHFPYVEAGMAVVAYEIDGPYPSEEPSVYQAREALRQYQAADAGRVNFRNALEYTLARMPEVDPGRIYVAGHSSAATLALLVAEGESRLHGCIAYAPATRLRARFGADLAAIERELPGASDAIDEYTPRAAAIPPGCRVMLFHAEDDSNVPIVDSRSFADELRRLGRDVTLRTVRTGDHYDSMIDEGIPAGIAWIQQDGASAEVADRMDTTPRPAPIRTKGIPTVTARSPTPKDDSRASPTDLARLFPTRPAMEVAPPREVESPPQPEKPPAASATVRRRKRPTPRDFNAASRQYVEDFYLQAIAADDATLTSLVQWFPAGGRPSLGLRWGVGAQTESPTAAGRADSVSGIKKLTGAVGPGLVSALQVRMDKGAFGTWPNEGEARLRRVQLLGNARQADLLKWARAQGLDLLAVFTLDERLMPVSKKRDTVIRLRIVDVVSGLPLWASVELSTNRMWSTKGKANDAGAAFVAAVQAVLDEQFTLKPLPDSTVEEVTRRVEVLADAIADADVQTKLRLLLEVRFYQARGRMKDDEAERFYQRVVGVLRGETLAAGSPDERLDGLYEWLEEGS